MSHTAADRSSRPPHPSAVALMDAMDRLLGEIGYARISSRQITEAAGLAHGSIRYHFGSLQGLLVATLRRSNEEMFERQRRLYTDRPTLEIWRTATRKYLEEDVESGWALRVVEALIIGIRDREAGEALAEVLDPWRELIREATHAAVAEYGLDLDERLVDGVASLVENQQLGMLINRLAGLDDYHEAALDAVDALLEHLESRARPAKETES